MQIREHQETWVILETSCVSLLFVTPEEVESSSLGERSRSESDEMNWRLAPKRKIART